MSESKVIIHVTQEDIATGQRVAQHLPRTQNCPVAQAILREFPDSQVSVSRYYALLTLNGERQLSVLPPVVSEAVSAFDKDKKVEPFDFELLPPQPFPPMPDPKPVFETKE